MCDPSVTLIIVYSFLPCFIFCFFFAVFASMYCLLIVYFSSVNLLNFCVSIFQWLSSYLCLCQPSPLRSPAGFVAVREIPLVFRPLKVCLAGGTIAHTRSCGYHVPSLPGNGLTRCFRKMNGGVPFILFFFFLAHNFFI